MHNICGSEPLIPVGMPDTSTPLTPEFFVNPRCPPSSSSVFPAAEPVKTIGEDLPTESLPPVGDGVDIPPGPPARSDKEPNVVAEGWGLKLSHARRAYSLCKTFYFLFLYLDILKGIFLFFG